ncbi:transposase, partial [mine drainage metagenome]
MKVRRTEQIFLRENETISHMCHLSKNLYNQANYILRQQFINKEKLTTYGDLVKIFQAPSEEEDHN